MEGSNFGSAISVMACINNYDPITGTFIETLMRADGTPLQFDGLWDLLPLGCRSLISPPG